jgi:hypothetical protein
MRLITSGVSDDGLSCLVSVEQPRPGVIWKTPGFPPELGYQRPRDVDVDEFDVGLAPGAGSCQYIAFPPNYTRDIHRFDGYSILTVFGGAANLILQKSKVDVAAGDIVILPAVIHGWECGPAGLEFSSVRFGLGRA